MTRRMYTHLSPKTQVFPHRAVVHATTAVRLAPLTTQEAHMNVRPCTTLEEALAAIDAHKGSAEAFTLPIADSLNDTVGTAMAVITEHILARGWEPDGYEQGNGFRIYRYQRSAW